jgi:hypothetical protein
LGLDDPVQGTVGQTDVTKNSEKNFDQKLDISLGFDMIGVGRRM